MLIIRRLIILNFVLALFATAGCAQNERIGATGGGRDRLVIETASGDEHQFYVELADDPEERRTGLMYRTEMAEDAGMLFDFETVQPISMWMKNTLIPLDMAFIDEEGVIRRIAPMTTPKSLVSVSSGTPVLSVLEVNGGTFEKLGIKAGDRVRHPLFNK
ncbi:DUF192 domain-containing protein [Hyphococcus sp. DH-69]|uniref:DUF192 domain-containing protein n=1 Tax=Hyphococcus formosus TaxID=3143534 RepID=UPI00398BB739